MKKEEENKGESERETKGRKTVGMKGEEKSSEEYFIIGLMSTLIRAKNQ